MSKLSIRTKLFIAFLAACSLSIGSILCIFKYSFNNAFLDYLKQQESKQIEILQKNLLEYYDEHGTWEALINDRRAGYQALFGMESRLRDSPPPRPPFPSRYDNEHRPPTDKKHWEQEYLNHGRQTKRPPPNVSFGRFIRRLIVTDAKKQAIIGIRPSTGSPVEYPLVLNNVTIGYLALYPYRQAFDQVDQAFAEKLNNVLWIAALIALFSTAFFSYLLARQLVKPIQQLRNATAQLTQGIYGKTLTNKRQDELGHLINDFNELSLRLKQNEQARQQWIMDIAHELRTPLAILRGEIEAIQDGIVVVNEVSIGSLHQEVTHLSRLVDDLYTLSMSDSGSLTYHKQVLNISPLLQDALAQFSASLEEKQLSVHTFGLEQNHLIYGDEQRLLQLFHNLLKNTLRYTDSPGQLQIHIHADDKQLVIQFCDSAPSVPDEALPKLFERLYRVESSRNRNTGGAGIGLSICYNIVQAHQGSIIARHAALGGLSILITLPLHT